MEAETGVWKPEVGGKAWRMISNSFQVNVIEVEIIGINHGRFAIFSHSSIYHDPVSAYSLHETAEKAILAGVKVINLEGKEVVVTRDSSEIDELASEGRILSPFEAEFYNFCKQDSNIIAAFGRSMLEKSANGGEAGALQKLYDIAFNMEIDPNPEGSARLKAAQDRFASLAAGNEDPADPSQRDETDGRHRDPNFKGAQYPVVADPREITTPTDKRNGDPC